MSSLAILGTRHSSIESRNPAGVPFDDNTSQLPCPRSGGLCLHNRRGDRSAKGLHDDMEPYVPRQPLVNPRFSRSRFHRGANPDEPNPAFPGLRRMHRIHFSKWQPSRTSSMALSRTGSIQCLRFLQRDHCIKRSNPPTSSLTPAVVQAQTAAPWTGVDRMLSSLASPYRHPNPLALRRHDA